MLLNCGSEKQIKCTVAKWLFKYWVLYTVCKITFETWADALSGHDIACKVELSGHCAKYYWNYGFKPVAFAFSLLSFILTFCPYKCKDALTSRQCFCPEKVILHSDMWPGLQKQVLSAHPTTGIHSFISSLPNMVTNWNLQLLWYYVWSLIY